ncbi:hypothetical protein C0993_010745 [Termitomyces sp. T159_Od127]|nr:hypothetical protein C0993_010745 [Termitomyces sp. T159_Od127]
MAKKKKTQLKPVARGFATTSVPKKITQKEAEETEIVSRDGTEGSGTSVSGKTLSGGLTTASSTPHDPEKVEEQALQNLVDKLQERTEKEITRPLKRIDALRKLYHAWN